MCKVSFVKEERKGGVIDWSNDIRLQNELLSKRITTQRKQEVNCTCQASLGRVSRIRKMGATKAISDQAKGRKVFERRKEWNRITRD